MDFCGLLFPSHDRGGSEKRPNEPLTRKGVKNAIERTKAAMETINHRSPFTVEQELISTMNYIRLKYRTNDEKGLTKERLDTEYDKKVEEDKRETRTQYELAKTENPYLKNKGEEQ